MKITCNKRDDILKRKQEYESDRANRQAKYDEEYRAYRDESRNREDKIRNDVIRAIGNTSLDLEINVDNMFESRYRIRVSDEDNKFDDDKALSWTWEVSLDKNGDVKKESSSWSGLNAVSATNLSNLKEIVRVLEVLNNIDFKTMLNQVTVPDYNDYITGPNPKYESSEDFDQMLLEADVEDLVGTKIGVKCSRSKYYRGYVYLILLSETDKTFAVKEIPAYYAEQHNDDIIGRSMNEYAAYSIRKDTLYKNIVLPLTTIDFSK